MNPKVAAPRQRSTMANISSCEKLSDYEVAFHFIIACQRRPIKQEVFLMGISLQDFVIAAMPASHGMSLTSRCGGRGRHWNPVLESGRYALNLGVTGFDRLGPREQ